MEPHNFTSKARWLWLRDQYLLAARSCVKALTDTKSFWAYDRSDSRVKEAARQWVEKAFRCHRIAMGREPVMRCTVINHGDVESGFLYAEGV